MNIEVYAQLRGADRLVGRLYGHRRRNVESATFSYDDSWLASADAYALDPRLPLEAAPFQTPSGQALFGCFSDCAPDRWGRNLIKRSETRRAKAAGEAPRSFGEIDYLLGVPDDARQGALRFRPVGQGDFVGIPETGLPHLIDLSRLLSASDTVDRDGDGPDDDDALRLLLRAGSSLGGARPKAHVVDDEERLAIAKFPRPSQDTRDVAAWEHVALTLARRAGIRVPPSELLVVAGRSVFLVRRFDRDGARRIGYVSAMTMLEAMDGAERSYLEIADAITQYSASPGDDLLELWRRIAFSILVSNTDDHLRNHGFLQTGRGGWSLSPAFDLNPDPEPGPKNLSLTIDYDDPSASIETLLRVAPEFGVEGPMQRAVLAEVEKAVSDWRSVANEVGLTAREIDEMEPAFEHHQRSQARKAAGAHD